MDTGTMMFCDNCRESFGVFPICLTGITVDNKKYDRETNVPKHYFCSPDCFWEWVIQNAPAHKLASFIRTKIYLPVDMNDWKLATGKQNE